MATAIYMRVSTDKQADQGVSLETQKEKLKAYCTIKDFENVKEYIDVGSGRTTERPNFKRMIKDVKNKNVSNVVVFRLDRLTRSIIDLNKLINVFDKYGCRLHSSTESLDTSTANGRLMVNLIGVFAQWESETISERVSINMQSRAEKGIWQSAPPFGFYLGDDKRLKIKEDEAKILREAFNLIEEGHSFTSAERAIARKYNLDWTHNYLTRKVRQASTIGNMERNGTIIKNTHEGIITKEKRDKLLTILEENRIGRRFIERDDIFRRRIACYQCGSIMMVSARSHNDYKTVAYSYVCEVCHKKGRKFISVAERLLEEAFLKYMKTLPVAKLEDETNDKEQKEINNLKEKLNELNNKKDRIQRAWINSMISDEDLMLYKKEIESNIYSIEEKLNKLNVEKKSAISNEEMEELKEFFTVHFDVLTRKEKRKFIQKHIQKIHFKRKLVKGYKKKYNITVTNVEFFWL